MNKHRNVLGIFGKIRDAFLDRGFLWAIKGVQSEFASGIAICRARIGNQGADDFLARTREALALIEDLDPRRHKLICRQFDYIIDLGLDGPMGEYHRGARACLIDHAKFFGTPDPEWNLRRYACLLIHEATHGRIDDRGVGYEEKNWERIERLCHLEEYRFAEHFGVSWAKHNIGPFDPTRWWCTWERRNAKLRTARRRIRNFFQTNWVPW